MPHTQGDSYIRPAPSLIPSTAPALPATALRMLHTTRSPSSSASRCRRRTMVP